MYMFSILEKNRSIRFSCGPQSVEWPRFLLALALSVLAHAMAVLPGNFKNSAHEGERGSFAPHIVARLVGSSAGGAEDVQVVSEKQVEATEKQFQYPSDAIQPDTTPLGKDNSLLPQKSVEPVLETPEMRYFSSDLLTIRPYPLTQLESPDLSNSLLNGSAGRIVLKVWVSDAGEVTATETEFTEMPIEVHEAIVAAFQRMRFMPGEIGGKPVGSILRIEMTYEDIRLSAAN
jgi:hypothetical protein